MGYVTPRVFKKAMQVMFKNVNYVKVFLDDILIHSRNELEHLEHIKRVLNILKDNNTCINFEKSSFMQRSVKYLGSIIDENGIRPDVSRLKDAESWFNVKSKKGLQRMLGYINWFRPYVTNLSGRLSSITEKLKTTNKNFTLSEPEKDEIADIFKRTVYIKLSRF